MIGSRFKYEKPSRRAFALTLLVNSSAVEVLAPGVAHVATSNLAPLACTVRARPSVTAASFAQRASSEFSSAAVVVAAVVVATAEVVLSAISVFPKIFG